MPRRWRFWGGVFLVVAVSGAGAAWFGIDAWRARAFRAEARRAVARGDWAGARPGLSWLAAHRPGRGEAALEWGDCLLALGEPDQALTVWARVPSSSPLAGASALRLGRLAVARGRFTAAEDALVEALRHPGPQHIEARELLLRLFWREGRFVGSATLIEDQWRDRQRAGRLATAEALDLIRGRFGLDYETFPIDEIEADLRRCFDLAPDDDRIWLARGVWAQRAGRFADAATWLEACATRRPDDPVVWRARLDLARAADRPEAIRDACAHLPAADFNERAVLGLRAWLAARRGDAITERAVLDRLVLIDPFDPSALGRLAELLISAGQTERAARLRARKARLDEALNQYVNRFKTDNFAGTELELAGLASELGRRFEARAFSALAARRDPDNPALRASARLSEPPSPHLKSGLTLADLIAADLVTTGVRPEPARTVPPLPAFRDDARAAGLAFAFDSGMSPRRQLPETMSGGVGLLDYDGDGWLDVYLVQGGPFPPPASRPCGDRLYRNRGDGTFADVSEQSGIAGMAGGYGHGVAVGDFDNDGFPDLFLTRWRSYALYRNRGDGTFEDVTERVGFGGDRDWPTSAAWADLDNDGDLDLYVCHYLVWDADDPPPCPRTDPKPGEHRYTYCNPHPFPALPDHLFRNDAGRFVDVSTEAGIVDRDGRGLGVVAADLDDDGQVDLFVANDTTANYLFHNQGDLKFSETGLAAGVGASATGGFQAGMGVACGDLDGDGRFDLTVTNFYGEATTYFQNLGGGLFRDRTDAAGLAAPSRFLLGFGLGLSDVNNDGRLDLMAVNGHVIDDRPKFPYPMPALLLIGDDSGRLIDVSAEAGPCWKVLRVGRGLATGDLDNDGRIDALVVAQNEPLAYFHNQSSAGRSITIQLEGTTSNRDGVGARVAIVAGGKRQVAQRVGGGSYLSAGDGRLHFGTGTAERVESIEVRWPSGRISRYNDLATGTGHRLREGETAPRPLKGFASGGPHSADLDEIRSR